MQTRRCLNFAPSFIQGLRNVRFALSAPPSRFVRAVRRSLRAHRIQGLRNVRFALCSALALCSRCSALTPPHRIQALRCGITSRPKLTNRWLASVMLDPPSVLLTPTQTFLHREFIVPWRLQPHQRSAPLRGQSILSSNPGSAIGRLVANPVPCAGQARRFFADRATPLLPVARSG